jgi:8-oxo-dGTP diphosphatase
MYDTQAPFVAAFVVLRKEKKVALVLRENTKWMNGFYGMPSGKVEKNENFTSAAIREGFEEVGVTIEPQDLKYIHTMHRHGQDMDWVDVYFEVDKWKGEVINAEPDVHREVAWFDLQHLPQNIVPPVRAALVAIERGETYSEYGWEEKI